MSVLVCSFQGRMGNQAMQYLFARGFAEHHRLELRTEPWVGERMFQIEHPRPDGRRLERWNEAQLLEFWHMSERPHCAPGGDNEFRGYAQTRFCASFYTKRQAQSWLKLRPEIENACAQAVLATGAARRAAVVAHRRCGDYFGYGYPVVSEASYRRAADHYGLKWQSPDAVLISEESPIDHRGHLPDDLSFMPDFYRMMTAPTLLRGNSSFSWLAALLGDGLVLSPVIDGLEGGKEHDTHFVPGNWPRFANLDFTENLYVSQ